MPNSSLRRTSWMFMLTLALVLVVVSRESVYIASRFNSVKEVVARNVSFTDRMIPNMAQFADLGHGWTYQSK
jgi:hypothetical protein